MAFSSLTPAYRIGLVLMLLASAALGVMALQGLRNHRDLVWSEAREEAGAVADRFEAMLDRNTRRIRFYEFPPRPGSFDFDAGASDAELRKQMNLDERTSSGLPVAVLAAFEVAKRSGGIRDGEQAYTLALKRWPDLTSPRILQKLAELAQEHGWEGDFRDWQSEWDRDEKAREIIREVDSKGWVAIGDEVVRIEEVGEGDFDFLSLSNDAISWRDGPIYGLQLEVPDGRLGEAGESVLKRSLGSADLVVGVLDPDALEAEWRSRRNGTLLTLGLAIMVIGGGSWTMTRGLVKEQKAAHARSEFVASVTHELRAPVGAMRLIADALCKGHLPPEKIEKFHDLLARESGRLSVLIENVMDLARVEDGQRVVRRETVDLPELVGEVCEMMKMQAREADISLRCEGSALTVKADPVILRQILVNLLDNAIKFSPAGSTVTLSWDEGWSLSVADQGPGIAREQQTQVFERFYRGEDELRRETQGVGIGLSLVKELAELHGGVVNVSNQGGAVFRIVFPDS